LFNLRNKILKMSMHFGSRFVERNLADSIDRYQ